MADDLVPRSKRTVPALKIGAAAAVFAAIGGIAWMREVKADNRDADPIRTVHPYRLAIKLTIDPQSRSIDPAPLPTTLRALLSLPRPALQAETRISPLETRVWQVRATVRSVVVEPDGDLVLGIAANGMSATAEVPDPALCSDSPFRHQIEGMRAALTRRFHPESRRKDLNLDAEITGIGFAGFPDSGTRTGVRIYPVLTIRWIPSGSAR